MAQQALPIVTNSVIKTITLFSSAVIWTPAVGKRFRLQMFQMILPGDCTAAAPAEQIITLVDLAGPNLAQWRISVITTNINGVIAPALIFDARPNGYLGAGVNGQLRVNFATAPNNVGGYVTAIGSEE